MVYALHSGNLFGTERMALETLQGFPEYPGVILSPPGPLIAEARKRGHEVFVIESKGGLVRAVLSLLRRHSRLIFMSTALTHVLCLAGLNILFRRRITHLHLVHGGADEFTSFGRKKLMNPMNLLQVAVSDFVRLKLIQYGVKPDKIRVVGNFLTEETVAGIRRHAPFESAVRPKGLIISRIVPDKRVHLLFEAMEAHPTLRSFHFDVYGTGGLLEALKQRADQSDLPISMKGFASDIPQRLADYDFLLHLNSEEPFGLVVLEAMAAGIPVVVPDRGGTAGIIRDGENGLLFKGDDINDLAARLEHLCSLSGPQIQAMVDNADHDLSTRYAPATQVAAYRALLSR